MKKSPKGSSSPSRNPQKRGVSGDPQGKGKLLPLAVQRALAMFADSGIDSSDEDSDTCPVDVVYQLRKHHKRIFNSAFVLCVIFGVMTLFSSYSYHQERKQREIIAFEQAQENAQRVASQINNELARLADIVDAIAADLSSGTLEHADLTVRLRQETEDNPDIFGLGAAYELNMYKPDVPLYAPYYMKDEEQGGFKRIQVEHSYDYTVRDDPTTAWYTSIVDSGEARWVEPYFAQAAQTWLAEYVVSFYADGDPAGVLYIDHSFDTFGRFVNSLDLGEEGYSFIMSQSGKFVAHPDKMFLGKTVFEKADEFGNERMRENAQRAISGESFEDEGIDQLTGQPAWIFYEPIPLAGWSVGIVMDKNVLAVAPNQTKRNLINIALSLVATLFFLSILAFRVDRGYVSNLWVVSSLTGLFFIAGIGYMWHLEKRFPPRSSNEIVLVNRTNLNEQLAVVDAAFERDNLPKPVRIPTGVMIETITFGQANENMVSGYIWQKYPPDFPKEDRGILFTDALDFGGGTLKELYTVRDGEYEVTTWFFIANMRQEPSVQKYPLDQATVQLQIWPHAFHKNIILVPDLDGYEFINPTQQPGLVDVLVLEDWYVNRSYFSFRWDDYNASLGSSRLIRKDYVPDLYFNIVISRFILSPIIAYAITLLVVMGLMFGVMVIDADSSFNVLSYAAALFFVVAVSHVGLRGELMSAGVVYLEYFFIVMYVVLLIVSINSILFYSKINFPVLSYKNNLIPKLLYWPVLMGVLFTLTLQAFYPPVDKNEAFILQGKTKQLLGNLLDVPSNLLGSTETITSTAEMPTTTMDDSATASPLDAAMASPSRSATPIATTPTIQAALPATAMPTPSATGLFYPHVSSDGADPVVLRYGIDEGPTTLDPSLAGDTYSTFEISNLFIGLTRLDVETGEVLPSLATEWSISDDGLVWTFTLRQDVPWVHYDTDTGEIKQATDFDGNPLFVSAEDAVYGIQRNIASDSRTATLLYDILHAKEVHTGADADGNPTTLTVDDVGVEAVDDWTVRFTLATPAPYFPSLLSYPPSFPVPSWSIKEWGDEEWTKTDYINTSGPYMLIAWDEDSITLGKNPLWYAADEVQIDTIEQPIREKAVLLEMFRNDELDTLSRSVLNKDALLEVKADTQLNQYRVSFPNMCTQYFGFINTNPPFDDARVRRAFSAAIDRAFITDEVMQRGETPATSFAPPGVFGAVPPGEVGQGYEPELAQQLLQAYLDEMGLTIEEFNQAYPIVLGQGGESDFVDRAVEMWQEVLGVEVDVETLEWDAFIERLNKETPLEETFHIYRKGWCADYADQNNFLHQVFNAEYGVNEVRRTCADANCTTMQEPSRFDELTLQAGQVSDPEERKAMYREAEEILAVEEAAYAPIYHYAGNTLTKPWVTRNYPSLGAPDFDRWRVDSDEQK